MITANDLLRYAAQHGGLREATFTVSLKRTETADGSTARVKLSAAPASLDSEDVTAAASHGITGGLGKGAAGARNILLSGAAATSVVRAMLDRSSEHLTTEEPAPRSRGRRNATPAETVVNGSAE